MSEHLACVHCHQSIDTGGNYQPDPPAHVHCAFRALPTPMQGVVRVPELLVWLGQFTWQGYVIRGNCREFTADTAEAPYRVGWDIPAAERADPTAGPHCGWLAVAQTPCPGDPSTPWDELPATGSFLCREKHAHPILRRRRVTWGGVR